MARSAGIHISLTTLTVLALVEGNMKDTVTSLGWRSISVAPINHQTRRLSKDLAKHGIHVRLSQSLCNSPHNESLDGTVTDMKAYNETLFQQTLSCGMKEPYRNVLIISRNTLNEIRADTGYLAGIDKSVGLIVLLEPDMKLIRMMKMSSTSTEQVVVMPFKATEFDLQGLEIVNYNLPYFPFIVYDCTEDRCDASGYYPDLMQVIGKKFNFSVKYKLEPSGDWGMMAQLGNNASNVLQKVHTGESAFTLPWVCTFDKSIVFDCIAGGSWIVNMYMIKNDVKVSMDMLLKPFTIEAWGIIILFLSALTIAHKVLKRLKLNCSETNLKGMKSSMAFFSWVFVTVIIAFYRSAMVLAFTTDTSIPFLTILEGLGNQEWNLVYDKGTAEYTKSLYSLIPKSESRVNEVMSQSYEYASNGAVEAFEHLVESNTFLFMGHYEAFYFFRTTNCDICKKAIKFGEPKVEAHNFLLEKYSPIREVLTVGVIQAWEKGIHETIVQSYLGPPYKPIPNQTSSPVTLKLMVLVLIYLGSVALIMSPTILIFEYACRKLAPNRDSAINGRCNRIYEERICPECGCTQIHQKLCIK